MEAHRKPEAVGKGEAVGLVGESGCGKSITWLAALGLLGPRARVGGQVLLEGRDLVSASRPELERVRGRPKPRWRRHDGQRLYEWDTLHGHVEVYNSRGLHLGVADAVSGKLIEGPVAGRKIDV